MADSPNGSATSRSGSAQGNQIIFLQNIIIATKLKETNYLIWRQQILATVKGYGLEDFLTGNSQPPPMRIEEKEGSVLQKVINPEYISWERQDQIISAWIQSSLSESVMVLIVGLTTTSSIWTALETNFANQSRAKVMQYKHLLQTLKKGNLSMAEYLSKIKTYCDLLNSVGHHVSTEDQITHIFQGLGREYDPVMVAVSARADSWSPIDVHSLLLTFESRLETTSFTSLNSDGSQPSVNYTARIENNRGSFFNNRGRGGYLVNRGGYNTRGGSSRGGYGRGRGRNFTNKVVCQVCLVPGHAANRCWYRYDQNFVPKQHQQVSQPKEQPIQNHFNPEAHMAHLQPTPQISHPIGTPVYGESDYNSENIWYPDSGATNHVSHDLSNLNSASEYQGSSQLQMGNGQGINIAHIGSGNKGYTPRGFY